MCVFASRSPASRRSSYQGTYLFCSRATEGTKVKAINALSMFAGDILALAHGSVCVDVMIVDVDAARLLLMLMSAYLAHPLLAGLQGRWRVLNYDFRKTWLRGLID